MFWRIVYGVAVPGPLLATYHLWHKPHELDLAGASFACVLVALWLLKKAVFGENN